MRSPLLSILTVVMLVACTAQSPEQASSQRTAIGGTCTRDEDCTDSKAAQELGRCAPDVVCDHGTCRAECLGTCEADPRIASGGCPEASLCTASAERNPGFGAGTVCTKRVLRCASVAQCPTQKPGVGEWSCTDGICRFPGYAYPFE